MIMVTFRNSHYSSLGLIPNVVNNQLLHIYVNLSMSLVQNVVQTSFFICGKLKSVIFAHSYYCMQ